MSTQRDIHAVLKEHWGFDAFRSKQEDIIRSVLEGKDTLALLPTGAGKSLCYQVPALALGRMALVVSPLIALMKDQVARLKQRGISAVAVTSGMRAEEIDRALDNCVNGKCSFLYVSPERLGTDIMKARLPKMPLGLLAVDEAHCVSQWGYDFRPSYLKIREARDLVPKVPVLALTASATPRVADDIAAKLGFANGVRITASFRRPEITYWTSACEDKLGRLLRMARRVEGTGIVYVRERRGTLRIAQTLQQAGISAAAYHAGLPLDERDRVQRDWTDGRIRFVVATTAFGMGIDKPDVRLVMHVEPPADLESYYQEAGRAGRDGQRSYAVLLHAHGDHERLRERLKSSFPAITEIRRVYQAFADQHRIAMGAGELETYGLDLRALAERVDLKPATVAHALKALELDGVIALSEGVRDPSRVMITAPSTTVYGLRVSNERLGPLLDTLLRMHGGLFEEAVMIEEERIAKQGGSSVEKVVTGLRELEHLGVLMYKPRHDGPSVTLLVPRRDPTRLMLSPEALRAREQRATERLEAMFHYLSPDARCREREILAYFGEASAAACGHCDVCREKLRATQRMTDAEALRDLDPSSVDEQRWEMEEGAPGAR